MRIKPPFKRVRFWRKGFTGLLCYLGVLCGTKYRKRAEGVQTKWSAINTLHARARVIESRLYECRCTADYYSETPNQERFWIPGKERWDALYKERNNLYTEHRKIREQLRLLGSYRSEPSW